MASRDRPNAPPSSKSRPPRSMEAALLAFGARVSSAAPRAHGSIVVHCTDTGEDFALEGTGTMARVNRGRGEGPHQVEVRGPAAVLRAIAEGRQEPARALAAGGIRVRGDLRYLEAVLKDAGLLECP
jgi:SCP-2 sterol transfer family